MSSSLNFKKDFPFFSAHPECVYLDSAATTHKPQTVITRINNFYTHEYSSAHRSMYSSAEQATEQYEQVRQLVSEYIKAPSRNSIVFTKNATESIQLVAENWARHTLKAGDEIVLTELEHHSNIVPWQQFIKLGVKINWVPVTLDGFLDSAALSSAITPKTKLVALTGSSNVLGDIRGLLDSSFDEHERNNFIKNIITKAHAYNARVLIDASQLIPHEHIDVAEWGCDFAVFSAHKMLGPQGVGVLYVRPELHKEFQAGSGGGGTVFTVEHETALWRPFPYNLEAGTQAVAQVVGFGAALTYFKDRVDFAELKTHENNLYNKLLEELKQLKFIRILGPQGLSHYSLDNNYSDHVLSFTVDSVHPHDCAAYLETKNILVRAGHHCASLLHKALGAPEGSVRISLYLYNTLEDIDKTCKALADLPYYFNI